MIAASIWWLAATLAEPAIRLFLRQRLSRGKELPARVCERRGRATLPRPEGRVLWLHAASVGETLSLLSLLDALCGLDATLHILVTTGSLTSERLLASRLQASAFKLRVRHQFVPLDVPRWLGRFLRHWRPQGLVLIESELWPNLIAHTGKARVPMALVNARLSLRSLRAWRKMPGLASLLLRHFRWIAARSHEDAERLRSLGAIHVESLGDLKAAAPDLPASAPELRRLQRLLDGRPVLLAACTHATEEPAIARTHAILAARLPRLLTIIAPRHPNRGADIAAQLGGVARRSLGQDPPSACGLWICDTLGEMGLLYRLAAVAFIGNSLDTVRPGGGHNPFEPARLDCAIATGPRSFNFNQAVHDLREAGAITTTATPEAIAHWAFRLLDEPELLRRTTQAARTIATAASNLTPRLARRLIAMIDDADH